MTNFGLSSAFKTHTTNYNSEISEKQIISVRVLSIVLDENHPRFNELGGWSALGAIEYEPVNFPFQRPISKNILLPIAYPSNPNIKNYPLINEIVYILPLPNNLLGEVNTSIKTYYINIVGLWNHPHHNGYPLDSNKLPSPQEKTYSETQIGNTKKTSDTPTEIFLGSTFKEKSNIHPLLPFEGDIIVEGRFGNSIRFGSTIPDKNEWSSDGKSGDPILILRNGQGEQTEQGWTPITEQINNDDSLIYLTSTQTIPIKLSSDSYISYGNVPPDSSNSYKKPQIILNSGRIIFNSYDDHILLSSIKSINLNSKESINIDTKKFITQADKIFLGTEELAVEPLMLGNSTVDLLKNLIVSLKGLANTLKTAKTSPAIDNQPSALPTINLEAISLITSLNAIEKQLNNIVSKRNFTV